MNCQDPPRTDAVLFPAGYTWLVFAGSLDILMTYVMLGLGAVELNAIANHAIALGGLWGLIALKFAAVATVLAICEYVGRRRLGAAQSLVRLGVTLNFLPVVASLAQLVFFFEDWTRLYLGQVF